MLPAILDRERFEKFVYPDPNSGCFIWGGACNNWGYGSFGIGRRSMAAHRYAWLLAGNELPAGLFVLHKCDTPCCVNPEHLYLGTHQDNMSDMARRQRGIGGALPRGVYAVGRRFAARMRRNGKRSYLGTYPTIEEAAKVAIEARGKG